MASRIFSRASAWVCPADVQPGNSGAPRRPIAGFWVRFQYHTPFHLVTSNRQGGRPRLPLAAKWRLRYEVVSPSRMSSRPAGCQIHYRLPTPHGQLPCSCCCREDRFDEFRAGPRKGQGRCRRSGGISRRQGGREASRESSGIRAGVQGRHTIIGMMRGGVGWCRGVRWALACGGFIWRSSDKL